jgi:multimeric flavodoxin WrbA
MAEAMAEAMAQGARSEGANVDIRRVPETAPEDVARASHYKMDHAAPLATITGGDGSRMPSETELEGARHQSALVARTAAKLSV